MTVEIPLALGDGLALRPATPNDAEALASYNDSVLGGVGGDMDAGIDAWTMDLMSGAHPTSRASDFTVVEDTRTRRIVSSLCLIPEHWAYEGVPVDVGRVELVSTDPEYRGRGLVRAQFDVIHAWSAERGELMQGITGIPWFYRQFGYEMALQLHGGRMCSFADVPKLAAGTAEPFAVRPATEHDIAFLDNLYRSSAGRGALTYVLDHDAWCFLLTGATQRSTCRQLVRVIATAEGVPVGMIANRSHAWDDMLNVRAFELAPGVPWPAAAPSVLRYLAGPQPEIGHRPNGEVQAVLFALGPDHPLYAAIPGLVVREQRPYAWYIRVPDVAAFLRRVAPALENRLAASCCAGHNGELKLSFYRSGVSLVFEEGRLASAKGWNPGADRGHAAFPFLTFLQLLLGYRSLADLRYAYADCWVSSDAISALLDALWPKRPSNVWTID
jgi:hypothetical protein